MPNPCVAAELSNPPRSLITLAIIAIAIDISKNNIPALAIAFPFSLVATLPTAIMSKDIPAII